jgi:hypothetical protein
MTSYATIEEYCKGIGINEKAVIDYVFNYQNEQKNPNTYTREIFNRYSDLSVKKTSSLILKNIQDNKIERFTKKVDNNTYSFNDELMVNKLFNKYKSKNITIVYVMNLINNIPNCKTSDILYLTAKHFDITERSVHRRIKKFQKSINNTLPLTSFLYHLKWKVMK